MPVELLEVSVTEPPAQKVVAPVLVIVGVVGMELTRTGVCEDVELHKPFETVTE